MITSLWKGYKRYDFVVYGRDGLVIVPDVPAAGNPWVWRAEFFDAFAQVEMAMLEKGWYLAYYKVSDMYGCPEAIRLMNAFQYDVEKEFDLSKKTVLFGFSRGGFYSFNYAAEHLCSCIQRKCRDSYQTVYGFGQRNQSDCEAGSRTSSA